MLDSALMEPTDSPVCAKKGILGLAVKPILVSVLFLSKKYKKKEGNSIDVHFIVSFEPTKFHSHAILIVPH